MAPKKSDRVTIRTVAEDAGVSVAAVSKVLRDAYGVSDALRDKVQASMQQLGYRPHAAARGMRGQTYTLGFLIPDLHNPFFADIMAGVNTALERTQYQTLLGVSDSARTMERALVDNMIDRRMDGLIIIGPRMRREGAPIGGEGNGGVILSEMHLGRDAPVGAALILQLLHEEGRPLSAIARDYPRYAIVKDKLNRPNAPLDTVYDTLRTTFSDAAADTQDGLRLSWDDRWVHVRPSGTEPIVRVIAEAPTEREARALIDAGRSCVEALGS